MSDFDSGFWNLFVAGTTLVSIVACGLLLATLSKRKVATDPDKTRARVGRGPGRAQ
jgi:cytochrome c oxidase cbb3-type subunit 3